MGGVCRLPDRNVKECETWELPTGGRDKHTECAFTPRGVIEQVKICETDDRRGRTRDSRKQIRLVAHPPSESRARSRVYVHVCV